MNKKANTLFFVLGATVVNILFMTILFVAGLILIGQLPESVQENAGQILVIVPFFIAIGVSFFLYNRLMKYLTTKIDMDKYFHPIFSRRRTPPNNE